MSEEIIEESEMTPEAQTQEAQEATSESKSGKGRKKERKKLTPEQKKRRTVKALIITGAVVLALAIFISGIAIGNTVGTNALIKQGQSMTAVEYTEHKQLVPTKSDDEWTYFTMDEDREFKVLQFTDVHIGGGSFSQQKDAWAMNAVATMIRKEQPDLVVITGDIAYPVPFQAGTFNNLNATRIFSQMMESLQVYWTFAFGNHDTEAYSMYSRREISEFYESQNYKYCLYQRGFADDDDKFGDIDRGFGNHIINVKNKEGNVIESLVIFDSHSYTDGDYFGIAWKYDNIHQSQVDWYKEQMEEITRSNGAGAQPVKNLAFFHIPLVEYREAWKSLRDLNKDLAAGDVAYVDGKPVTYYYGVMGESEKESNGVQSYGIYCGFGTDELFEEGLTHGLQGIFCGHDHYNNFSINYNGIRLTYGMSIDYLAYPGIYKEHSQRGCTVITLSNDGAFNCTPRNYYKDYDVAHERG